jgi:hypothetical protein
MVSEGAVSDAHLSPRPTLAWLPNVTMPLTARDPPSTDIELPGVVRPHADWSVNGCVATGHDKAIGKGWISVATGEES